MAQVKEFIVYSATKAEFEAQVASGEVDNTQIGVIAETGEFWEKGNYHPLVDLEDYLKKTDAVELAKDLTGSLEATPEEFVFRASAGTKSIRDESAVIRRIKGNTSVWGQLAEWEGIGNKAQDTLATYEIGDNSLDITYNKAGAPPQVYIFSSPLYPAVTGHKYLCTIDIKTSKSLGLMLYPWYDIFLRFTSNQSWTTHSAFYTPTRTNFTNRFYLRFQAVANQTMEVGDSIHCRNLQFFDLTQIFGAGNEPMTIEEFKKLYPESYYPYCAPEVRSMRATGIETIGANAFNKDSVVGGKLNANGSVTTNDKYSVAKIEVVPYEKYTLTNVANAYNSGSTYALYDSNDAFLSIGQLTYSSAAVVTRTGDVTMPSNARYMRVVVHNDYLDSCCVNLKHSGTLTAEDATYFKEARMLPDIAKYFPEGMHGIGEVFDEINEENAIKRFGVRAYEDGDNNNADVITDGTNTVYALAEPIVNPITEPLQWDYKVADFGTEKMLSDLPSSPFRADIVYQFNAADRIRDNGRNIERLEEQLEPFVREIEVLDGLIGVPALKIETGLIVHNRTAWYALPTSSESDKSGADYVLATEDYIRQNMPTEAAPATQVVSYNVLNGSVAISPNIMYEYQYGVGATQTFVFPSLYSITGDYEKVWMMRLPSISSSNSLSISYSVKWKDGIAPTFSEPVCLEIYLKKIGTDEYIGEWKIYK